MTPAELESLFARHAARLPRPRAPQSLLPRVLASIRHRPAEPWHRRGWRAWPAALQLAAVALCAGLGPLALYMSDLMEFAFAHEVLVAVGALWRLLVQPVAVYLAAFGVTLAAASAMCVAALKFLLTERGANHEAF